MEQWAGRAGLDRLKPPSPAESAVIRVDAQGRIAGEHGIPHVIAELRDTDIYLGMRGDLAVWARPVAQFDGAGFAWPQTHIEWQQAVAAALALMHWHVREPLCEACGAATEHTDLGVRRRCVSCGELQFVRTDPAVIVAVLDPAQRLLLARQKVWAPRRHSVVAGFVEPGESLEQACWREVAEETGVTLSGVAYVASQPWPMPRSLMVGFVASTEDRDVRVDGIELESGGFLSRADVLDMQSDGSIELPSPASLGRLLIERWLRDELPVPGR